MTDKTQFRKKTINGFLWSAFEQGGRIGGNFIIGIVLARLLGPDVFGLMAMVFILVGFAEIFVNFGFGPALIQKQNVNQVDLSSVFWLNVCIGIFLTLMLILCTPVIVSFYNEPRLYALSIAMSPIFVIRSLNIVQKTLLHKKLNFKTQAKIEVVAILMAGLTAIVLAYWGYGIWSLVAQQLLMVGIAGILYWIFNAWRPSFLFSIEAIKDIFGYSSFLFASQFLGYWTRNLDKLLIGKYFNSTSLGIYSQAYKLIALPTSALQDIVMRVLFPSFSVIQNDKEKIASIFLNMIKILGLISFPMMSILYVVSDEFVLLIYGAEWIEMIPLLKAMCFLGIMIATNGPQRSLFLSMGKSKQLLYLSLLKTIFMLLAIGVSISYGIYIIAISINIAYLIMYFLMMYFGGKLINISVYRQIKNLISSIIISIAIYSLVNVIVFFDATYLQLFIIKLIISIISYFVFIFLIERRFIRNILRISSKP